MLADDPGAVVGPDLKIRGLDGIRIADASVFPTMPAVNPMIGVLMVGEKCRRPAGAAESPVNRDLTEP